MKQYTNLRKIVYALILGVCVLSVCLTVVVVIEHKNNQADASDRETEQSPTAESVSEQISTETPSSTMDTTESLEEVPEERLYNCIWDASVQTDQYFEFYPDGTGRVINLVGRLLAKGVESEFTYELLGGSIKISWESGEVAQWYYSASEDCFTRETVDYDGSTYHQKIERISLYDLYVKWAKQLNEEITYCSENEWMSQTQMSQGAAEAYKSWDVLLNEVYDHLMRLLPQDEAAMLTSEQQQWVVEKEDAMDAAYDAYYGGTAAPMVSSSTGADYTERRTYELLLLLPEGFDHEAHDIKISSIRERYYAVQGAREQMNTVFFGTSAEAYYLNGELLILTEYSDVSQSETPTAYSNDYFLNCTRTWYYDDGEVYFIFMVSEENGDEYRLCFENGELIRWISPDGEVYDLLYRWEEMQGYYDHALSQCESVKDRGAS